MDGEPRRGGRAAGPAASGTVSTSRSAPTSAEPRTCNVTSTSPPTGSRGGESSRVTRTARRVRRASSSGQQRQHGDERADPEQVALVEHDRAGGRGDAAGEQAAPRASGRDAPETAGRTRVSRPRAGPGRAPAVRAEQAAHEVGGRAAGGLRVGGEQQPVGEHRHRDGLHVVGHHEAASGQRGLRAGRAAPAAGWPAVRRPAAARAADGSRRRARRSTAAPRGRRARGARPRSTAWTWRASVTGRSASSGSAAACSSSMASSAARSG